MPIGTCSCGAQNVTLNVPQLAGLVDKGMTEAICKSCEQRVLGKLQTRLRQSLRDRHLPQAEIDKQVAALGRKVSDEQTETTGKAAIKGE